MALPASRFRVLLFTILAIVILGAGGYALWWWQLAADVRAGVDRWTAERAAAGWTVDTRDMTVGGFPLAVHVLLPHPAITDAAGDAWKGAPLSITVPPWAPGRPTVAAPGRHLFTLGNLPVLDVTAGEAAADLHVDSHGLRHMTLDLADIASGPAHVASLAADVDRPDGGADRPALAIKVTVKHMEFGDNGRMPLGHTLSSVQLEARLTGGPAAGGLSSSLKQALAAWRDAGGTVEIDKLSLDWPPVALTGKGTLALDNDMQPLMASTCTVRGLLPAIDALAGAGTIHPKDSAVVKLVLGLMSQTAADGTPQWTVPLTVQDRKVYLGPAALMKLPPVAW